MDAYTTAQHLIARGAHVISVNVSPNLDGSWSKRPLTARGGHDASNDPEVVDQMFARPDANAVGVVTGASGIIVADIDRHPGAPDGYASLGVAGHEIPADAFRYQTTSGKGEHLVFAAPADARGGHPVPGVDVLAGASWVVWNGDVPDRWEFTSAPSWVTDLPRSERIPEDGMSAAEWIATNPGEPENEVIDALARLPEHGSPEWSDNNLLAMALRIVRAAQYARGGARAREVFLDRYAAGEWATDKHRAAARRAFDRAIAKIGEPCPDFSILDDLLEGLGAVVPPVTPAPRSRHLSALMAREFAPLDWVVPDLIPEGTTLLVAPPKAGKSWLALDVALAAATGTEALGCVPTGSPRPVLYVDLESGERRLQDRVRKQGWRSFGRFDYLLEAEGAAESIRGFLAEHRGQRPLVVLDTLAGVVGDKPKDRSAYRHDYETLAPFQRMTKSDPGAAVLIVHHTRKMVSSDPLDKVSGTNGYAGAIDTPVVLDRPDRHSPDGSLNVMARDFEGGEFAIVFRDHRWHLVGGDAAEAQREHERAEAEQQRANLGAVAQGALQVIESEPGRIWSIEDVMSVYGGTSGRDTVTRTLNRLADSGQIQKMARGMYCAKVEEPTLAA